VCVCVCVCVRVCVRACACAWLAFVRAWTGGSHLYCNLSDFALDTGAPQILVIM
jgi:hypothetical protein